VSYRRPFRTRPAEANLGGEPLGGTRLRGRYAGRGMILESDPQLIEANTSRFFSTTHLDGKSMVEDRREPGFGLKWLKEGRLPAPPIPL